MESSRVCWFQHRINPVSIYVKSTIPIDPCFENSYGKVILGWAAIFANLYCEYNMFVIEVNHLMLNLFTCFCKWLTNCTNKAETQHVFVDPNHDFHNLSSTYTLFFSYPKYTQNSSHPKYGDVFRDDHDLVTQPMPHSFQLKIYQSKGYHSAEIFNESRLFCARIPTMTKIWGGKIHF